jgi:hypothetical protein
MPSPGEKSTKLPFVVLLLTVGTFLMSTTEFIIAGLLPEMASDLSVSVSHAGLLITAFAIGMIVGAPTMAIATLRLPRRSTLILALAVFAVGHVIAALSSSFTVVLAARVLTALATGAFWSVAAVVAAATGPAASSRALGVIPRDALRPLRDRRAAPGPALAAAERHRTHHGRLLGRLQLHLTAAQRSDRHPPTSRATGPDRLRYRRPGGHERRRTLQRSQAADHVHHHGDRRRAGPAAADPPVQQCRADRHPGGAHGPDGHGRTPIATALSVRFAHSAPTVAAALAVSGFNTGIALGSWVAGSALDSSLGLTGPALVGTVMIALGLIPLIALAAIRATRTDTPGVLRQDEEAALGAAAAARRAAL